jgi:hypothetical protein
VAAEGRRTPSNSYETIKPVEFSDLRFAGARAENARGNTIFYEVRISGSGLLRARQQAIASDDMEPSALEPTDVSSDQLPPHAPLERSYAAPGMSSVPEPNQIPLIEAVHELRVLRNIDLRAAISEMIDLLATGQLPMSHALIDGVRGSIDARWWWAGSIEYPNSSAAFNLVIEGEERLVRATEIYLDHGAWERQRSRFGAATQEAGGPFPKRSGLAWDCPVRLLEAISLWSPEFARLLGQMKWRSPEETLVIARQRRRHRTLYDHPRRERLRQGAEARTADTRPKAPASAMSPEIPQLLRDDLSRLLREWDRWDDTDRIVNGSELAARLIIEKTKAGQPYILKCAPPGSRGDLDTDYQRVGEAWHDGLLPCHCDIPNSMIRNPGSNWLSVRIYGGIEGEGERLGKATPTRREPSVNSQLRAAVQTALRTLGIPGRTVQWKPFCDRIRAECKATAQTRGYGDKSIQRLVKTISAATDKPDK